MTYETDLTTKTVKRLAILLLSMLITVAIMQAFPLSTLAAEQTPEIKIYDNLEYIIDGATITIKGCVANPATITIPRSINGIPVTSIGHSAFADLSKLTSIVIPDTVTTIEGSAFYNCSSLNEVSIPNSVTSIGQWAFYGCSKLTAIIIPEKTTIIEQGLFWECSALTSVSIPNSIKSIESMAFYGCVGLTNVTIPNSVIFIGELAFQGCSSLASIDIPGSVAAIENRAFDSCAELLSISVALDNQNYADTDGVLYNKRKTTLVQYPQGRIDSFVIPNSVTVIGESAFRNCDNLTDITIANSVKTISESAFSGCDGLTIVSIPNGVTVIDGFAWAYCENLTDAYLGSSVTSIGEAAFGGCVKLTNITIPNSVITIGEEAFSNCNIDTIYIPQSVTTIGMQAFNGCTKLISINVANGNPNFSSVDGVLYNSKTAALVQYPQSKKGSLIIPNGIVQINDYALQGSTGLTNVIFPDSLTSIGRSAFYGCTALTNVTMSNGLNIIGHSAFYWCSSLSQVIIPESVTSIETRAFQKCGGLVDIYFESTTPPYADSLTFMEVGKGARALVPIGSTGYGQEGELWLGLIVTPTSQPPAAPPLAAPTVILNGDEITFDVLPRIQNGRVLVPLRAIFEAMGATVNWDNITKTATAKKDGTTVILTSGSETATINGRTVALDQPGVVINGRTLAPLRFVGEAFGGDVHWDETSRTVYITTELP